MGNLVLFIFIVVGVVTPITIIAFKILFKNSLTFKIGVIVTVLLDVISILSFTNGAGGNIKMMVWMGPIGVGIIILGFFLILKNLKKLESVQINIESFAEGNFSTIIDSKLLERNDEIGRISKAFIKMQFNFV